MTSQRHNYLNLLFFLIALSAVCVLFLEQDAHSSVVTAGFCVPAAAEPVDPATWIYVITASGHRAAQKADLTRLAQTLSHVRRLHWVVVETGPRASPTLRALLRRSRLPFTHLAVPRGLNADGGRGMAQRDAALAWLRRRLADSPPDAVDAVVYFADDDNAYDVRLFEDYVRRVGRGKLGVWPVGFAGHHEVESARLDADGRFLRWLAYGPQRTFAIDMAGFALHASLVLRQPYGYFGRSKGKCWTYEECFLLRCGLGRKDIVFFGHKRGAEVLVWHTNTRQNSERLLPQRKGQDFVV